MPHHLPASAEVVVIGGGAVGLATAWRAAQRGAQVALLERERTGSGTSHVAAGMLAPVAEADPAEPALLRLAVRAASGYADFIAALGEATPLDPGYRRCGTLMVARDGDEAEALRRAQALRAELGLPVRRLRASEARAVEPALAPTLRLALELNEDHAVDPRLLTAALADALRRAGGEVVERTEVVELVRHTGRITGVRVAGGQTIACEQVVVAAGAWSGAVGGLPAEARVPLRPVKGQILRLRDPTGPGLLSRVLRLEQVYVVPRGDGRYVLGATMEERGFDVAVTAGAVWELLRDAIEVLPGAAELIVEELSAGVRPATPDNAPVIGPGALEGLVWATGHHRNGILLAPLTAELLAATLAGEDPEVDLAPFSAQRFARIAAGAAR